MRNRLNHALTLFLVSVLLAGALIAKTSVKDLPPRYRTWLTDEVNYIITNEERDTFLLLPTDADRDKFIANFWEVRNPTPGAPGNAYKEEIYKRIEYAKEHLGGVHTAMGQTYVTLGEPKQRAPYIGRSDVRNMEIWFYQNTNPALPPYFNVVFFDPDNTGDMRFYSPYMDGPARLTTSVMNVGNNKQALQTIDRSLGREVARTTLSLLPGSPVDMQNATASLESDVMLGIIRNLANHPLTKAELEQKRMAERVTHRVILDEQFLDVLTVALRDTEGNFNLHYLLRMRRPADFLIEEAEGRTFYNVDVTAHVFGPDNKLIYQQHKTANSYLNSADLERLKHSAFGYEGWLPLAPGKYRVEFLLTNKLNKTAYRAERDITIPAAPQNGLRMSDVVAFSAAENVGEGRNFLPFTLGGVKFTPLAGDALTFAPGQSVSIFYQLWAPPNESSAAAGQNVSVDYAYGRPGAAGDTKDLHEQVDRRQFDPYGSMLTGKKIALAPEAGAGNYRLMISATDPADHQKVYSSLNFRVYSGPGAAPPYDVVDPDLADDVARGVPDFNRALCALAQNDKDSALRWFKVALMRNPQNEVARSRLAQLYYDKQQYADVAALFARSPVTRETDEEAILRGADSIARTGSVPRAISLLENALNIRGNSGPLYLALAGYYRDEGNNQKAVQLESKGRELIKQ